MTTVLLGTGADFVLAQTGQSTLYGGSGTDVYGFHAGLSGGDVEIHGFAVGQDFLTMQDYAPGAEDQALAGAVADGHGGTAMTLADGTRIDLIGVSTASHALFS